MTPHRVPMLRPSLRRYEDPDTSDDPRVQAVVAGLRAVDYAPAPRPEFRGELRQYLVGVAPRLVAESAPKRTPEVAATSARRTARHRAPKRRAAFVRPLQVATAVVAVFVLLLGGAVWKSQSALPGDSLYGLKRTSENVQLDLLSGSSHGDKLLSYASIRANEADDLAGRESASAAGTGALAGGMSSSTAKLITSTLQSANADLRSGWSELAKQANKQRSTSPVQIMAVWAPKQLRVLQNLQRRVSDQQVLDSVGTSLQAVTLAQAVFRRTIKCGGCLVPLTSVRLPTPTSVRGGTQPTPATPTSSGATTHSPNGGDTSTGSADPSGGSTGAATGGASGSTGSTGPADPTDSTGSTGPTGAAGTDQPGTSGSSGETGNGTGTLPTSIPTSLPTSVPTLPSDTPLSISTCSAFVAVGSIIVQLGTCPHGS